MLPGRSRLTCLLYPCPLACTGVQDVSRNSTSTVEGAAVLRLAPLPVLPGRHCQVSLTRIFHPEPFQYCPSSSGVGHSLARCRSFLHGTGMKGHECLSHLLARTSWVLTTSVAWTRTPGAANLRVLVSCAARVARNQYVDPHIILRPSAFLLRPLPGIRVDAIQLIITVACEARLELDVFCLRRRQARRAWMRTAGKACG